MHWMHGDEICQFLYQVTGEKIPARKVRPSRKHACYFSSNYKKNNSCARQMLIRSTSFHLLTARQSAPLFQQYLKTSMKKDLKL